MHPDDWPDRIQLQQLRDALWLPGRKATLALLCVLMVPGPVLAQPAQTPDPDMPVNAIAVIVAGASRVQIFIAPSRASTLCASGLRVRSSRAGAAGA